MITLIVVNSCFDPVKSPEISKTQEWGLGQCEATWDSADCTHAEDHLVFLSPTSVFYGWLMLCVSMNLIVKRC